MASTFDDQQKRFAHPPISAPQAEPINERLAKISPLQPASVGTSASEEGEYVKCNFCRYSFPASLIAGHRFGEDICVFCEDEET